MRSIGVRIAVLMLGHALANLGMLFLGSAWAAHGEIPDNFPPSLESGAVHAYEYQRLVAAARPHDLSTAQPAAYAPIVVQQGSGAVYIDPGLMSDTQLPTGHILTIESP